MTMEERANEIAAFMRRATPGFAKPDELAAWFIELAFPELTGPNPTHVIVPVEPTEAMREAGKARLYDEEWDEVGEMWRAMLAVVRQSETNGGNNGES